MTLQRAQRKFARVITDTVVVERQVTLTIPKDSVMLRIVTDTTHVVSQVRQGRATVRIVREPHYTTVYAECDSATIARSVLAKVPQQQVHWGVSRWYKRGFYLTAIALAATLLYTILSRRYTINITRK